MNNTIDKTKPAPGSAGAFETVSTEENAIGRLDPWITSSLLQKAIRRGDAALATAAALRLYQLRGAGLWRRLLVIAFEDIGIAAPGLLTLTALASDPEWRGGQEYDVRVISSVVPALAQSAKDRSPDHLTGIATSWPELEDVRCRVGSCSLRDRIAMAADIDLPLTTRAIAAWFASGLDVGTERRVGAGDLRSLLDRFSAVGVCDDVVSATETACRKTRELICIMAPVLSTVASEGPPPQIEDVAMPSSAIMAGIPMYALDEHTRLGKTAIARFVRENHAVAEVLNRHVPDYRIVRASEVSSFHTDASPIDRCLRWHGSHELETLGIMSDLVSGGVAREGVDKVLFAFAEHRAHLDHIRADLFLRQIERKVAKA